MKMRITRVMDKDRMTQLQVLHFYLNNFNKEQLRERGMTRASLQRGIAEVRKMEKIDKVIEYLADKLDNLEYQRERVFGDDWDDLNREIAEVTSMISDLKKMNKPEG